MACCSIAMTLGVSVSSIALATMNMVAPWRRSRRFAGSQMHVAMIWMAVARMEMMQSNALGISRHLMVTFQIVPTQDQIRVSDAAAAMVVLYRCSRKIVVVWTMHVVRMKMA